MLLLPELLATRSLWHTIFSGRIVQDRLVDQESSVTHTGNLLKEIDGIEAQIVTCFIIVAICCSSTSSISTSWLDEKLLVKSLYVDLNQVFDVLGISKLLIIDSIALFVLAQKGLASHRNPL